MFNHRMFSSGVALAALMAAAFGGCKDSTGPVEPPPPPPPSVRSVSVSGPGEVFVGQVAQFTVEVICVNGECDRSVRLYVNGVLNGDTAVGTINAQARYTPPARYCMDQALTVQIRAVSADTTKVATASIAVREPPMGNSPRLCWTRWFGTPADITEFRTVVLDPQDNIIVGGTYRPSPSDYRGLLVGFDAAGILQWERRFGSGTDSRTVNVLVRDASDNGYFFAGIGSCGKVHGNTIAIGPESVLFGDAGGTFAMEFAHSMLYVTSLSGYVARLDPACNLVDTLSGALQVQGQLASLAVNGTHYLVAYTAMVGGINTNISSFLEKRNNAGVLWQKRFPDVESAQVIETPSGVIYFAGLFSETGNSYRRFLVAQYDQDGNETRLVFGPGEATVGTSYGGTRKPVLDPRGGIVVVDGFNAVLRAWALDESGQTRWTLRHTVPGGLMIPGGAAINSRGELIVVGHAYVNSSWRGYITRWRLP